MTVLKKIAYAGIMYFFSFNQFVKFSVMNW